MKKRIKKMYCDTEKDLLAHECDFGEDSTIQCSAYFHRNKYICYLYKFTKVNGVITEEKMIQKTDKKMNKFLEFMGSPSRILRIRKKYDEYNKQNEETSEQSV